MKITQTPLKDLLLIKPEIYQDNRGCFLEVFQQEKFAALGFPTFVQDNISRSKKNVLRGLHYQIEQPQGKLVWVSQGAVFDVAVDLRRSSKTFGQWFSVELSDSNRYQLYIPPGFAHGFCVLSDSADFYYKCTNYYFPSGESGVAWNDKDLNIPWPVACPTLSTKDLKLPLLSEIDNDKLFT